MKILIEQNIKNKSNYATTGGSSCDEKSKSFYR